MGLALVTAPAVEPITLQDARAHIRVVNDDEDSLIEQIIIAAREIAEVRTARVFIQQEWAETFAAFPGFPIRPSGSTWNHKATRQAREGFALTRSPVIAISSLKYIDVDGVEQTINTSDYRLVKDEPTGRVVLAYGKNWPTARDEDGAVRIKYTAGYGTTPEDVPSVFRHAIRLIVGHYYENREPFVTGTIVSEIPMTARALLKSKGLVRVK